MYPYIVIDWAKIYFVSIGVILSIFVFIFVLWKWTKHYRLNFWKFFLYIPIALFLMYILGSFVYFVFFSKKLIPTTFDEFITIAFPIEFKFHFIGLSLGFLIVMFYFLNKQSNTIEKFKWIDAVFYSLMIAIFVLWIFLVLGDNFIWKPTDSEIGVSSLILCDEETQQCFKPESKIDDYTAVHPVGIYLSLLSIIVFASILLLWFFIKKYWVGLLGFILFLLGINIVFVFQQYPRYFPISFGEYTFDIKNYWTIALIVFLVLYYIVLKSKK